MIKMSRDTFSELMRAMKLAESRGKLAEFTKMLERAVRLSGMGGETNEVSLVKDWPCSEEQASFVTYGENGLTIGIIDHQRGGWSIHS